MAPKIEPVKTVPVAEVGKNGVYADFNDRTCDYVLHVISLGATKATACKSSFITEKMLDEWLANGEKALERLADGEKLSEDEKRYAKLLVGYEKAIEAPVLNSLKVIKEQQKYNWNAAAWMCERLNPERFAKPDKMDVKHSGKVEIKVALTDD